MEFMTVGQQDLPEDLESQNHQQKCQVGLRRLVGSAIVVVGLLAFIQIGVVQGQWQAVSAMDRVSSHDRQRTLGLMALPPPPPPASGLHISGVDIEITDQDGITVNIDIPISVRNNMSDTFKRNNWASSKTGDVERLNGAFVDNVIPSGGTYRLKGMEVKNDATDNDRRLLKPSKAGVSAEKAPGGAVASERSLTSGVGGASPSLTPTDVDAVHASSDNFLEKEALKHMLKSEKKAVETKMLDTVMTGLMPLLNQQLKPDLKGNIELDMAKGLTISDGKSKTVNVNVTGQNASQAASYDKLLEALLNGQAAGTGPVVIDGMHIKIKKQHGFQFNFAPKIEVANDMSDSFQDNNKANSLDGNVLRANGAFKQNQFEGRSNGTAKEGQVTVNVKKVNNVTNVTEEKEKKTKNVNHVKDNTV